MMHPLPAFLRAALAGAALAAMNLPALASDITGRWMLSDGKITVQVAPCGGNLCGKVVALKEPISKIDGKPKIDRENPNPALRTRPILGLDILVGMKPDGENAWKGAIYNADDGKTYASTITLSGDKIKLRSCIAAVLCKTNTFMRVN